MVSGPTLPKNIVNIKINFENAEIEFSSDIDDKIISDLIKSAGYTVTSIKNV